MQFGRTTSWPQFVKLKIAFLEIQELCREGENDPNMPPLWEFARTRISYKPARNMAMAIFGRLTLELREDFCYAFCS
jgi:hypothetical protein